MSALGLLVATVGLIGALNLVLTMGVIRRLREHAERLASPARLPAPAVPPLGKRIGDFTTTDVNGDRLSLADLTGQAVVAFFTPECAPCKALLPRFVARVDALPAQGWHVVAVVVVEPDDDHAEYRSLLAGVARTVVEAPHGPVQAAFGAAAFPAIAVLDERHTVVASGSDTAVLDALSDQAAPRVVPGTATETAPAGT